MAEGPLDWCELPVCCKPDVDRSKKDRFTIAVDKSYNVAQLVRALLVNSKVPGSTPCGVTDDFLSFFHI